MNRFGPRELKAELRSILKRPSRKETDKERNRKRREDAALRAQFSRMHQKDLDPNNLPLGSQGAEDPTGSQSNFANYTSSSAQSEGEIPEQGQGSWWSDKQERIDPHPPIADGFDNVTADIESVSSNDSRSRQLGESSFSAASGPTEWPLNPRPVFAEKPKSGVAKLSQWGDEANEGMARDRIYKQFCKLEKEYASIKFQEKLAKPLSLVQIDMALYTLVNAFTNLSRTASDMKTNYVGQIRGLSEKLEKAEKDNQRKIGQLEGKMEEREKGLGDLLRKQRNENEFITKDYKIQISDLENEVRGLKDKFLTETMNLKQQYEQQLEELKAEISQAISKDEADNAQWKAYCGGLEAKLTNEFNEKMRLKEIEYQNRKKGTDEAMLKAKQDHDLEIAKRDRDIMETDATWRTEVRKLTADWKTEVAALRAAYEADKAEAIKGKDETIEELKTVIDKVVLKARQDRDQVISTRDRDIEEVKIAWRTEVTELKAEVMECAIKERETIQVFKDALVRREFFKAMSDREVANNFQEIDMCVDDFARAAYPWDETKKQSWPFQAHELKNSRNDRRTKQNIIHNTLWVILFDMIFCTPFRMFGKEGKKLEVEWIKQYGNELKFCGVPCPRPSQESEKSRYEIIKVCVEAISGTSLQKGDFNYRATNQGYELTIKEAAEEMFQELEKVTSLGGADMQRLDELVKKAAKMWLEIGQQPCRMFLFMSESGQEKPMRSGPAALNQNRSMNLVIRPEVRKYGNFQGENLQIQELVMDCKGKFSVFQSS